MNCVGAVPLGTEDTRKIAQGVPDAEVRALNAIRFPLGSQSMVPEPVVLGDPGGQATGSLQKLVILTGVPCSALRRQ